MEIGDRIKRRREELDMSQEELAFKVGYKSRSSVNKIEIDGRGLPQKKILDFANALQTTPAYLMGWDEKLEETEFEEQVSKYDNLYKIDKKKFPLLGNVACGEPIFADEDRESYILAGTDIKADFCLICKGDSMINARIYDGDIVFIKKQDIVNNGEIAVVIIDNEATLKRFYYYKDQDMVILKPENSKYEDIILVGEELNKVRVLGKAVAFQSDVI